MKLKTELYNLQKEGWPKSGRHILAQFDESSIVVYQAYRPAIGNFAARNSWFGGEFSLNRMSWIKPNFLWMMYRSAWGTKEGQEVILAVRLNRAGFDRILTEAVQSNFVPEIHGSQEAWREKVKHSEVRLQWDPDHDPAGNKLTRRAIQLRLRGSFLARYAREWIVEIEDISDFVAQQRVQALEKGWPQLVTPLEAVYHPN